MATIHDLNKSLSEMDDSEALKLVLKRRNSRRIPKESNKPKKKPAAKSKAKRKPTAKKKPDLKAYFKRLTPDQQKAFLRDLLI